MKNFIPIILIFFFFFLFMIAGEKFRKSSSDQNFFTHSRFDGTWWMIFSLLGSTLTISGGIIASVAGAGFYGPYFLLAPLSGFLALIVFINVYNRRQKKEGKLRVLFCSKDEILEPPILVFVLASTLVFLFIIGWEIFVVSQVITHHYSDVSLISGNSLIVILMLAVMVGFYVARGGWDRSVLSDIFQTIGVAIFLMLLYPIIQTGDTTFQGSLRAPVIASTLEIVLFAIALFIINVVFSIVNLSYWHIAQSCGKKINKIFISSGLILIGFSVYVYMVSVNLGSVNPFSIFTGDEYYKLILVALVPLFMWSTVDTVTVAISNLFDQSLSALGFDVSETRKYYPMVIIIAAAFFAFVLNLFNPNIFQAILSATGSLMIFSPVLIAAMSETRNSVISGNRTLAIRLAVLFLAVFTSSGFMAIGGYGGYVFVPAILGTIVSTYWTWIRSPVQSLAP